MTATTGGSQQEGPGAIRRRVDLPRVVRARLDPAERYGLRLTLVGVALVLVAIPFATLTFQVLDEGGLTEADGRVANSLNHWVHDRAGAVGVLQAVSWMGRPPFLAAVVLVAVVIMWGPHHRRRCVYLVVTAIGGGIVDSAVKMAVDRPRPVVDHPVATALGKSFPSGHAMSSTVVYGALVVAIWPFISARAHRVAVVVAPLVAVAVGTSRLFLGVHFVSDVVGGYILGLAWLAAATAVFAVWRQEEPVAAIDQDDDPPSAEAKGDERAEAAGPARG